MMTKRSEAEIKKLIRKLIKCGFEVDEENHIINYDYQNPDELKCKEIETLRKKYNYRCQAIIK